MSQFLGVPTCVVLWWRCSRACVQEALPDGAGEGHHEGGGQAGAAQAPPDVIDGGPAVGVGDDDVEHLLEAAPADGLEHPLLQASMPCIQARCTGRPLRAAARVHSCLLHGHHHAPCLNMQHDFQVHIAPQKHVKEQNDLLDPGGAEAGFTRATAQASPGRRAAMRGTVAARQPRTGARPPAGFVDSPHRRMPALSRNILDSYALHLLASNYPARLHSNNDTDNRQSWQRLIAASVRTQIAKQQRISRIKPDLHAVLQLLCDGRAVGLLGQVRRRQAVQALRHGTQPRMPVFAERLWRRCCSCFILQQITWLGQYRWPSKGLWRHTDAVQLLLRKVCSGSGSSYICVSYRGWAATVLTDLATVEVLVDRRINKTRQASTSAHHAIFAIATGAHVQVQVVPVELAQHCGQADGRGGVQQHGAGHAVVLLLQREQHADEGPLRGGGQQLIRERPDQRHVRLHGCAQLLRNMHEHC